MQDHSKLQESILAKAAHVNQAAITEAITLCEQLPPPGAGFDDSAARCLSQTAFAAEQLQQYAAAEPLYSKALEYPGITPVDAMNTEYHLGVCLEAQAKALKILPRGLGCSSVTGPVSLRGGRGCL